jgi:hypothetical protein
MIGWRRILGVAVCVSVCWLVLPAATARADSSGSITATVTLVQEPIRELTVTAAGLTYNSCLGGSSTSVTLGFPDGQCALLDPVNVTNVDDAGEIDVMASNMEPSDGTGTPWQLCQTHDSIPDDLGFPLASDDPSDPTCDGPMTTDLNDEFQPGPAADQYLQAIEGKDEDGDLIAFPVSSTPVCDLSFSIEDDANTCIAQVGESEAQTLVIMGPSSSTDESTQFSNTVTWVALPVVDKD